MPNMSLQKEMIEVELFDRVVAVKMKPLVKLQAAWRGALTRKHLQDVRDEYAKIVMEIENSSDMQPFWRNDSPCHPMVLPKHVIQQKYLEKESEKLTPLQSFGSLRTQSDLTDPQKDVVNAVESVDNDSFTNSSEALLTRQDVTSQQNDNISDRLSDVQPQGNNKICQSKSLPNKVEVRPKTSESSSPGSVVQQSSETSRPTSSSNLATSAWETTGDRMSPMKEKGISVKLGPLPSSREEAESERSRLTIELLWIQQAINSRKQYLRMCEQLSGPQKTGTTP